MRQPFFSLRYRIAGLTFLLIAMTVCSLLYLANQQMQSLFAEYLRMPMGPMMGGMGMHSMHMGQNELHFLHSVHQSLIWVGLLFMVLGFFASLMVAGSITRPLQALSRAAQNIRQGKLGQHVEVSSHDEIGQLTDAFNQMAAHLAQNEKMRREFLANTAHELRTPLAILNGNLENMISGAAEPKMERLLSMQEEVMRLTRLVGSLRDLSLAELHQLPLNLAMTDINQLVVRAVDLFQPLAEEKDLQFRCQLADPLLQTAADRDRMNQVLQNLISNAVRYSPKGGVITLSTCQKGKEILIEVRDTGAGIAPEDLLHVFDYFYRGDRSRSRQSGGTGIGLSLVKYYSEAHGGRVEVRNGKPCGAVFSVYLPVRRGTA